jgi:hypothetical protein
MNFARVSTIFVLSLFLAGNSLYAACTAGSVAGKWAYTYTGFLILPTGPVPVASVGTYSIDAAGKVSGSQTRTVGGQTAVETITGTAAFTGDCTGTDAISVYQDGVFQRSAVLAFAYDNNGRHVRQIFESLTLPDGTNIPVVITLDGAKMTP